MANKIYQVLRGWTNWKVIAGLGVLFLAFIGFFLPAASSLAGEDLPVLDLRLWYSPQQAYAAIAQYGSQARQVAVLTHLTVDVFYPLTYGLLLSLLMLKVFRESTPAQQTQLMMFPWRAVFADLLENLGLVVLFLIHPAQFTLLAWMTALFTLLKWLQIGFTFVALLAGLLLAGLRWRKGRV